MYDATKVTLKCPACSTETSVEMPANKSIVLKECEHCGHMMKPKEGSCCVACSHGDKKCAVSIHTESQELA
jgi:uncharacterized Zn finger protein